MEGCRLQSRSSAITLSAGFGGGSGGEKRAGPEAPGAAEAKTAIESSGGDLNRATSIVFQRRLSKLQQENEELSVMLNELSAAGTWAYVYVCNNVTRGSMACVRVRLLPSPRWYCVQCLQQSVRVKCTTATVLFSEVAAGACNRYFV